MFSLLFPAKVVEDDEALQFLAGKTTQHALVSFAAVFEDVTQRKKRLLTFEQHSFPLFDQLQLLFHFGEPCRAKFAILNLSN